VGREVLAAATYVERFVAGGDDRGQSHGDRKCLGPSARR
jgi:hypothetical protein